MAVLVARDTTSGESRNRAVDHRRRPAAGVPITGLITGPLAPTVVTVNPKGALGWRRNDDARVPGYRSTGHRTPWVTKDERLRGVDGLSYVW